MSKKKKQKYFSLKSSKVNKRALVGIALAVIVLGIGVSVIANPTSQEWNKQTGYGDPDICKTDALSALSGCVSAYSTTDATTNGKFAFSGYAVPIAQSKAIYFLTTNTVTGRSLRLDANLQFDEVSYTADAGFYISLGLRQGNGLYTRCTVASQNSSVPVGTKTRTIGANVDCGDMIDTGTVTVEVLLYAAATRNNVSNSQDCSYGLCKEITDPANRPSFKIIGSLEYVKLSTR